MNSKEEKTKKLDEAIECFRHSSEEYSKAEKILSEIELFNVVPHQIRTIIKNGYVDATLLCEQIKKAL